MSSLHDPERRELLKLARQALIFSVEHDSPMVVVPDTPFTDPSGAFVTLRKGKKLRGCIGRLEPDAPLAETIAYCTYSAAREDPRFDPLTAAEISEVTIELSVLSAPLPISPRQVQVGEHGLIVSRGRRRGVLLPQVAVEYGLSAERFLEETCVKSGLPRDAWREPDTRIEAFTAEVFSEEEFAVAKIVPQD
jgi:AmmeMemoRadiSam system protein A